MVAGMFFVCCRSEKGNLGDLVNDWPIILPKCIIFEYPSELLQNWKVDSWLLLTIERIKIDQVSPSFQS